MKVLDIYGKKDLGLITYNGKDITNSSQLIEKWSINNQNFTEYTELVYYISKELEEIAMT